MLISRWTPPVELTAPTPGIVASRLVMTLSTNHVSCSSVMSVVVTTQLPSELSKSWRWTTGSRMPSGNSERTFDTASRTSLTARSVGVPMANSMLVPETPSTA